MQQLKFADKNDPYSILAIDHQFLSSSIE